MPEKRYGPTRGKILRAAAKLFAESGYHKVTTREIAQAAGMNAASMYYYFPSKADILKDLYEFYTAELYKGLPNLEDLLKLAETEPAREVLMKAVFHFNEDIRVFLEQILVSAVHQISADIESEDFIRKNIFIPIRIILEPLLRRMVELGKIKPFDMETFLSVLIHYSFSAAALSHSSFGNCPERYHTDLKFIFSSITSS